MNTASATTKALLRVEALKTYYTVRKGWFGKPGQVKAVDNVSFEVYPGEVLGIVGESGCGKSTLGKVLCRLLEPTGGAVYYEDDDYTKYNKSQMKEIHKRIQMIFQDPYASLNPRMSVRNIIAEAFLIHNLAKDQKEIDERVVDLLRKVGLDDYHANRYPHEFSGGQRQRVGIARALAVEPKLIIADEPVSALDVSIQSQVLNLMNDLKKDLGLTYIFVAHDLSVVEHISDRVGVMYLGNFAEIADKYSLYNNPMHPYTQALLSAVPIPDPKARRGKERVILEGNIPSALNAPSGCKFHTRCPRRMDICDKEEPPCVKVGESHTVYCHLYRDGINIASSAVKSEGGTVA